MGMIRLKMKLLTKWNDVVGSEAAPHDIGVKEMVIDNKNWLDDLYCWLNRAYRDKANFKEFCVFMSDFKKVGITYDELCAALRYSKKVAENIIELSILAKDNKCYRYRISESTYDNFCDKCLHFISRGTDMMLFEDFLERKDCAKYKEFDVFVSEQYKTISCRTMEYEPEYTGANISFFENIKKNKNIRKFCRMIDNLNVKEVNMFDVFEMYRSVYECVWCRSNKHHIKELIIYDAVISFFKYPEAKRKQVKFFDYLIVDIMKKYVMGHKKLDVTEMFPHDDLLSCPFCGKSPHMYMKIFWFKLIVTVECDDCFHVMSKDVIESSGLNQEDRLYINSFKDVISALVEKWNHRIKNDDMWLDDETLPDELPECEPDMPSKITYANGLKCCPFCGSKAGLIKRNSVMGRDGKRDPEGIKTIKVICSKGCFSASHFGTPERIPDQDTIGYMAYRWNQRKGCI